MFSPQFRPVIGGAERQAEKLATALAVKGVRVRIITPRYSPEVPLRETVDGVELIRFPLLDLCRKMPKIRGLGPLNLRLLRRQVARSVTANIANADLLHCHIASPMTAFAMQAAVKKGKPVICKIAMAGEKNDFTATRGTGIGGRQLCDSMVRQMSRWIAISKPVEDVLRQWQVPDDKIVAIPNGVVLPDRRSQREPAAARKFLYLGRLSANTARDVPTLIRAFDQLAERIPDAQLALVGDGDQFQETAKQVAACRNSERISMPGFQKPEPWLQWADCFVLPSRREGLSNALLEAMSYGLPCIANDIPPNREVLNDGKAGLLVPVGAQEELLQAMQKMAGSKITCGKMSQSALHRVYGTYGIESIADNYIKLYQNILAPK